VFYVKYKITSKLIATCFDTCRHRHMTHSCSILNNGYFNTLTLQSNFACWYYLTRFIITPVILRKVG